jgi:hypothetical protein
MMQRKHFVMTVLLWAINMSISDKIKEFMSSRQQAPLGAVATGKVQDAQPQVDYTDTVHFIESGRGTNMKAKTSSAKGHFQFIDSTWNGLVKQNNLGYKPEDVYDYEKSKKVFDLYTAENKKVLKKGLGREPNFTETYLAHKLDGKNAIKLLKASPNKSVEEVVSKPALEANKSVFYNKDGTPKKVVDVYKHFNNYFLPKKE